MGRAKPSGGASSESGPAGSLDPAAPLTLREAAVLVGLDEAALEERCADGSLLYESQRRGRKDVKLVRLVDLAEVFPESIPGALGGEVHAETSGEVETLPSASDGSMADAVRASDASRDALIDLCQDLEARLDLAERERQASTASLLMAQRRVLDLELQVRSRPWARAGGAMLAALSISAIVVALRLPSMVRDVAADEATGLRASIGADLDAVVERVELVETTGRTEQEALVERVDQTAEAVDSGRRAVEDMLRDARMQREAALEERARRDAALDTLEKRLEDAEDEARKRAAEFDLLVDAAGRDRARFAERLAAAERAADDARDQLAAERRASADERATFERSVADLLREFERDDVQDTEELRALREAVEALRVERASTPEVKEPAAETDAAPESWWTRTLRRLSGGETASDAGR